MTYDFFEVKALMKKSYDDKELFKKLSAGEGELNSAYDYVYEHLFKKNKNLRVSMTTFIDFMQGFIISYIKENEIPLQTLIDMHVEKVEKYAESVQAFMIKTELIKKEAIYIDKGGSMLVNLSKHFGKPIRLPSFYKQLKKIIKSFL